MVDRLSAVDVSTIVGKAGFRFGGQTNEGPLPQEPGGSSLGKSFELLGVLLPERAIDQQEILDQASLIAQFGGLVHNGGNHFLQKLAARRLVQVDGVGMEFL